MRVTIGERLGIRPSTNQDAIPRHISDNGECEEPIPSFIPPEKVLRLADCGSCDTVPVEKWDEDTDVDPGPARVTGHTEWLHKSIPVLVIHGRAAISPEEYAAGRRR